MVWLIWVSGMTLGLLAFFIELGANAGRWRKGRKAGIVSQNNAWARGQGDDLMYPTIKRFETPSNANKVESKVLL